VLGTAFFPTQPLFGRAHSYARIAYSRSEAERTPLPLLFIVPNY